MSMILTTISSCGNMLLELDARQRWNAVTSFEGSSNSQMLGVIVGVVVLAILVIMFLYISSNKIKARKNFGDEIFIEFAQTRGLTMRQRQLLLDVAINAGLKRNESIFNLSTAFDRSSARLIQQALVEQDLTGSENLRAELAFIREKLGFRANRSATADLPPIQGDSIGLDSMMIPVGSKLYIQHPDMTTDDDYVAEIIKNEDNGLTVEFTHPIKVNFGQRWLARYNADSSVWEFDTTAKSCDGDTIIFEHSDEIRLINRRRFLRVPVKKPASIANFPFAKKIASNIKIVDSQGNINNSVLDNESALLSPLEFNSAMVTELGGPGLKIETRYGAEVGDRLLLIFKLTQTNTAAMPRPVNPKAPVERLIEDIAIVRHVKVVDDEIFEMALELTGLTDDDVSELVRATNDVAMGINNDKNAEVTIGKIPQTIEI